MLFHTFQTFGKMTLASVAIAGLFSCIAIVVLIQEVPQAEVEQLPAQVQSPASLTTDTWGIFNPYTGEVLLGNNLRERKPIASITKLFTAETVLESPKKDEEFLITIADINTEGRAGKLSYGERVTPYKLLFPLLIESSNDAAEAIRRHLGSTYTEQVNSIQETLSLTDTKIYDASGLSPQNQSTVTDLATFYSYVKETYPHILDITQLHTYIDADKGYLNNNRARTIPSFMGGKQGFTDEAKQTFIGTFTVGPRSEEIGIVLLASNDILGDIKSLLTYRESIARTSDIMAQ